MQPTNTIEKDNSQEIFSQLFSTAKQRQNYKSPEHQRKKNQAHDE